MLKNEFEDFKADLKELLHLHHIAFAQFQPRFGSDIEVLKEEFEMAHERFLMKWGDE